MKKIFYFTILSAFLMAGLSALAQSGNLPSPGATPDSPFYFLKTWKEQIQTFFTFGADNKAKQYLHLSEVRLAEYQKMIERGKTDIAQRTLEKYNEQLGRALQKIQEAKNEGKNVEDILDKVEGSLEKHIEVLRENLQKVPEPGRQGIENALEQASKAIEKVGGAAKGCAVNNGTWLPQYKECENAKKDWCEQTGGQYIECASACRHNPDPNAICTLQCVPVCVFGEENDNEDEGTSLEKKCVDSGGTARTSLCCNSATDFPNQCLIGACGCAPDNGRQVKVCDCGSGKCFNGEKCVGLGAGNGQEGNNAEKGKGGQNKSD